MRLARTWLLLPIVAAASACESTPAPVVPTAGTSNVAAAGAPGRDASVPVPSDIVAIIRWKNPSATVASLTGCAGVPNMLADAATKSMLEALFGEVLRGVADPKQLAGVVALDAPVDSLVTLDPQSRAPEPMGAVSIGLTSLEGARAAIEATSNLVDEGNGMWRIGDNERDVNCMLSTSAGSTPARLLCGGNPKDLKALGPYMTRVLPTAPPQQTDIHGEFRWASIDSRYGQDMRAGAKGLPALLQLQGSSGNPALDRALQDAAGAVGEELVLEANDLDKVVVDVGSDANACLRTTIGLTLKSSTSWLAGTLFDRPERAGAPPAIFWRAPKDSEYAFYSRGGDPARFTEILRVARALVEGALAKGNVGSADDRKAVLELLAFPTAKDAASVQAAGHDAPAAAIGANPKPQQIVDQVADAYFGWSLVGVDQPSGPVVKWLRDLVGVYNREALMAPIRKELGRDAQLLPTIKIVPSPPGLGGGLAIEFKIDKLEGLGRRRGFGGKKDAASFTGYLLVMPDGATTWMAIGTNRTALVKRLQSVRSGAPAGGTLAARNDLEPLKSGRLMAGGYLTLGQLTRPTTSVLATASAVSGGGFAGMNDIMNALNGMPHRGDTPVFVTSTMQGGGTPRYDLSLAVTQGTVEDLGTLVVAGLRVASQLGLVGNKTRP